MSEPSIRTILVPLDGSSTAEQALPHATRLAKAFNARIVLMRSALALTVPGVSPDVTQVSVVAEAREYLASVEESLRRDGVTARSVVAYGPAAESILDNIELERTDLVVMSARGRTGETRWSHGGVAEKVVRGLASPVLVVQGQDEPNSRSILLPLDGSDVADALLPFVADVATSLGLRVTAVTVLEEEAEPVSESAGEKLTQARRLHAKHLEWVQRWLACRGVAADVEMLSGPAADTIARRVASKDVAVVAISSHGSTGVGRWVYGSVAGRLINSVEKPLLLVRAPGAQVRLAEQVRARRCHNCGREVYHAVLGAEETCPLCGFTLRACANCGHFDGVMCSMGNPWDRSILQSTDCLDFDFRETVVCQSTPRGQ